MLQILITFRWLSEEAAKQGIDVSESEVKQRFARFEREQFKTPQAFQTYLKVTGESLSDELLVGRMDEIALKLREKVEREGGLEGARRFFHEFPRRWAAQTTCRTGYIVPDCKEYKGPKPPEPSL